MDEKRYHMIADNTLAYCFEQLDAAYEAGMVDELDLQGGILTIAIPGGRTYLVTKHAPSLQLWYASPNLGGLHFSYNIAETRWSLSDGRTLYGVLSDELRAEGIEASL